MVGGGGDDNGGDGIQARAREWVGDEGHCGDDERRLGHVLEREGRPRAHDRAALLNNG